MKKYNFIYKTTNLLNGKIYVGSHCTDDSSDKYLGSGIKLINSVNSHGRENFKRDILEYCHSQDREDLYKMEEKWIRKLNSVEKGYNLTYQCGGGDLLTKHPDLDKIKLKISKKVRESNRWDNEAKLKNSEFMKNNNPMKDSTISKKFKGNGNSMNREGVREKHLASVNTQEYKDNMSIIITDRYAKMTKEERQEKYGKNRGKKIRQKTEEEKKQMSVMRSGIPMKDETKIKISKTLKGRRVTWGDKIGEKLKGRVFKDSSRKKLSDTKSYMWWVQLNKSTLKVINIFDNGKLLTKELGFSTGNITDMDKNPTSSAYGYKWKKFKKNEISKEEIYKLYGKSL